ncbi:MAG TPA: hypothetical protein VH092_08860 [Urbifossiella sp.]|jgi:hypothetical protein|nr:hypothetical protein [Urbifossiella sp.]
MDYYLQSVRTGETIALDPRRTLIGSAGHAAVRTAGDTPYLAAAVVRYPHGWVLHGLSDDPGVTLNRRPLRAAEQVAVAKGSLLAVGKDRFSFVTPHTGPPPDPAPDDPPPVCSAYIRNPDGMEECRAVDHDLLFGRLPYCHVQLGDTRLSRLAALLASHAGEWYAHTLSEKPIGRNRKRVTDFTRVEDGDELLIGPLVVRVEIRAAPGGPTPTDAPESTDDGLLAGPAAGPDLAALQAAGLRLEQWLKAHPPAAAPQGGGGLAKWLGTQRNRLARFWYDTPETTAARGLRTAGKTDEAFAVLDRAIRARPDSPELLRELYRLYEAVGLTDLCYRPLRVVEQLSEVRAAPDPWVLETLARLCERLGPHRAGMFDRAVAYWNKLEAATGVAHARERTAVMAKRALRDGGFARDGDGA